MSNENCPQCDAGLSAMMCANPYRHPHSGIVTTWWSCGSKLCASSDGAEVIFTDSKECLRAQLARLHAIIDSLPKTADGMHVLPGSLVFLLLDSGVIECHRVFTVQFNGGQSTNGERFSVPGGCYSTREAAEAAKEVTHATDGRKEDQW